jgi:biotin/methionine sulfoxide reductase
MTPTTPHGSHWGSFSVEVDGDAVTRIVPHVDDTDPSPLLGNVAGTARSRSRVRQPTVRRGWWEDGPGPDPRRGADDWLEVSWDDILDRLGGELRRVVDTYGHPALYAGSYGWASAGRFHHSQSQLRRFTGLLGGATVSVGTYSSGAAERILRHVVGSPDEVWRGATAWSVIAAHTDTLVAFGGLPAKNAFVAPGGVTDHIVGTELRRGAGRGMAVEVFSPLGDDVPAGLGARWHPLRPGTDVAVMLGLAHVLLDEGLADLDFCARYCHGTDPLVGYILGRHDGVAKTPEWAEAISEVPAGELVTLARRMAAGRTMVTSSWSLQRAQHGEQPVWMSIALAALLGQIGLPGGGFGSGYSSMADIGAGRLRVAVPGLPAFAHGSESWIPVARLSDMLLDPGGAYEFDGRRRTYPDIRMVYWVGGNPFHHHQDLNRLRRALRRPDTFVVHEPYWTATARHADVVLPATITLERNDLSAGRGDGRLIAMAKALDPVGEARDDYDIFAGLADRLGFGDLFREGRDEDGWLRWMYERLRTRLAAIGVESPDFDEMWDAGGLRVPVDDDSRVLFADFRADPDGRPLRTPSGRIELHSEVIDGFGYDDCPGGPTWLEPDEWLGSPRRARFPLLLVANNPATRLHSQLDSGSTSRASKVAGREPIRMHPDDAAARGLTDGDVVLVANDRGACLAGLVVTALVRPGVVQLSTGAWYDPDDRHADRPLCVHGNPNVLTPDRGTSRLAQACTGQHALVEVRRAEGPLPPVRAWDPPPIAGRATVPAAGRATVPAAGRATVPAAGDARRTHQ